MNILFLSSVFPNEIVPTRGCFNESLVRALATNHRVDVLSPIPWVDLFNAYRQGLSVPLKRRTCTTEGFEVNYVTFLYSPKVFRRWYGNFYWMSISRTIRSVVRRRTPDLIISYWAHPDGEAGVRISRMVGATSCVIIGGSDVLLMTKKPSRRRRVVAVLEATDVVITVNDHLKRVVERLGIDPDKVKVWHQGVDVAQFGPGDSHRSRNRLGISATRGILVWVGHMVPVKGLDILLESCALLRAQGVDYHLYLVGDGPLRRGLMAQTETHSLSTHITFVGPKLHDELGDWYRAADLTVLPSRSEGLPNVLRESLACGTPFVSTNVGGIPEIADPDCSLLVPPNDPQALADAIAQGLARWRGKIAQTSTCFQSWEESVDTLIRIMDPYVNSRSGTASLAAKDC